IRVGFYQHDTAILDEGEVRDRLPLLQGDTPAPRQLVHDLEAHVVPGSHVLGPRIPEPDDRFHRDARSYFFLSSFLTSFFLSSFSGSSSSFLPFSMTSGSAGVAVATAAASAGAATSSAFGMITCTIIMSGSLI